MKAAKDEKSRRNTPMETHRKHRFDKTENVTFIMYW